MKSILQRITIFTALVCGFALVTAPAAQAALFSGSKEDACKGANLSNTEGCSPAETKAATDKVNDTIQDVVNLLSVVVGIAAVIMIIISGLKYITSNGDSNAINSAKNGVIYAIVGLIIAALAQVIVRFVINKVG